MHLSELGWNPSLATEFERHRPHGLAPARVAEEHRDRFVLFSEHGVRTAEVTGRLRFGAGSRTELPAVGDWVAARIDGPDSPALIHAVLPRRTLFLRKVAQELTEPQVVAANVDLVFLVTDLATNFNLRRLERYLTLAYESGAAPVVLLNKADLCPDAGDRLSETAAIAPGVPVYAVSGVGGEGVEELRSAIAPGMTAAFLGSSGVGKSTLINRLLGAERLRTGEVRSLDGRGRHTTTVRQLLLLPGGGLVIDTPGMREIRLWGDEAGLSGTFEDIDELAAGCRFSDCSHEAEPGCAVRSALAAGSLDSARWESFRKLRRELRFLQTRQSTRAALEEKARWKRIGKMAREHFRDKYGNS